MPDRWEYKTISGGEWRQMLRAGGSDYGRPNEFQVHDKLLNGFGAEGWEVCAYSRGLFQIVVVLKRRIDSA